ncbi:hypothetical protein HanXRQr2_Chr13g0592951 [Helianthus annuus]|uniref:Uncharacterized protein n=1 Tax=Helianthus annuus TaxID=4232 RepID=A0A9K3EIR9_HELAN|nr:hypothetical protein HanXRQr2_Chr13g0592951 [Helianthus annuus]KAJ0849624.1 hypothetical protein HanPSC8_Chr13g0570941 [Helianthus annuus]
MSRRIEGCRQWRIARFHLRRVGWLTSRSNTPGVSLGRIVHWLTSRSYTPGVSLGRIVHWLTSRVNTPGVSLSRFAPGVSLSWLAPRVSLGWLTCGVRLGLGLRLRLGLGRKPRTRSTRWLTCGVRLVSRLGTVRIRLDRRVRRCLPPRNTRAWNHNSTERTNTITLINAANQNRRSRIMYNF